MPVIAKSNVRWLAEAKVGDPKPIIANREAGITYLQVLYNEANLPEKINFLEPDSHVWQTESLYAGKSK